MKEELTILDLKYDITFILIFLLIGYGVIFVPHIIGFLTFYFWGFIGLREKI